MLSLSRPALATDNSTCVQERLAGLGYEPGPVTETFDEETVAAARAFAESTGFPMPALSAVTAAEWCAVLSGWNARYSGPGLLQRNPLDFAGLTAMRNQDPAALPRGIHFGDSVPIAVREAIVSDLA